MERDASCLWRLGRGAAHLGLRVAGVVWALALVAGASSPWAVASGTPADVKAAIPVAVDIRPGLCPNHLRLDSPLTVPIAVIGTMEFDVKNIDPSSLRLSRDGMTGQCEPASWGYADVAVPIIGSSPECNEPRGDGLDDLALEFSIPDLVAALGLEADLGESVALVLSGTIVTGQGIEGRDFLVVVGEPLGETPSSEIGILEGAGDRAAGRHDFTYYTNVSDHITFAIYDVHGRLVERLNDKDMSPGIYHATWNGTGRDGQDAPAGTYFARVSNGRSGITRKIVVLEGQMLQDTAPR